MELLEKITVKNQLEKFNNNNTIFPKKVFKLS